MSFADQPRLRRRGTTKARLDRGLFLGNTGAFIVNSEMQLFGNGAAAYPYRFLAVLPFLLLMYAALLSERAQATSQLASQAQGQPGQFLEIDGTKIYYEECGSGPAIALLHDGLLASSTWDHVWPQLCAEFHVIRYDRRGYGRSDSPKSPFSPTSDLRAALQHTNSKSALIVGNSSGGALAIDFALENPEMVEGLFLIGPVVHASIEGSTYFAERGQKNNAPLEKGDVQSAAENWSKDRFLIADSHEAARRKFLDALLKYPQSLRYAGNLEIRPTPGAGSRLAEIQAPTIIVAGEFDIPDVQAYCGVIQFGVPDAVRVVIKDAGHLVQLEQPAEVAYRISRFTKRADRKAVSLPAKTLEAYAGQYSFSGTTLSVVPKDGRLIMRLPNRPDFLFYAQSDRQFFMRTRDVEAEFLRDSAGKVTELVLNQSGSLIRCLRV